MAPARDPARTFLRKPASAVAPTRVLIGAYKPSLSDE